MTTRTRRRPKSMAPRPPSSSPSSSSAPSLSGSLKLLLRWLAPLSALSILSLLQGSHFRMLQRELPHLDSYHSYANLLTLTSIGGQTENTKGDNHKVLVVYSGPTSLDTQNDTMPSLKNELYIKNFEYFLRKGGVDCRHHDTVLVVTAEVAPRYQAEVDRLQETQCAPHHHFVKLAIRENVCFDMESVRVVLNGQVEGVNATTYDYFIAVNCGMSGPAPRPYVWWRDFTQSFDSDPLVRMVGVSHHCHIKHRPHIQSMIYALDRKGLDLLLHNKDNSTNHRDIIYDCRQGGVDKGTIIERYEIGMSQAILNQGYHVHALMRNTTLKEFGPTAPCEGLDIWITPRMMEYYGRIPSIDETLFFKTSRVLTPEIAKLINYTRPITWNW